MVNCASSELRGGAAEAEFSYPLVKTFNSDVFPQAPSPLYLIVPASVTQPRLPAVSEAVCLHCPPFFQFRRILRRATHSNTSLRWTVLLPPQSDKGIVLD